MLQCGLLPRPPAFIGGSGAACLTGPPSPSPSFPLPPPLSLPCTQDLTRLKVPIAYLKHMFEDVFKERRLKPTAQRYMNSLDSASSFDQESEISRFKHRDSTGRWAKFKSPFAP